MYRLTNRIRSDDTIRLNTNTLFGPLFGTEANTKRYSVHPYYRDRQFIYLLNIKSYKSTQ